MADVVYTTSWDDVGGQEYLMGGRECLYYTLGATEVAPFSLPFSFLVSLVLWPGWEGEGDSQSLDFHTQSFIAEVEERLVWDQLDLKRWEHWME